jgi:S1-C subfamily serine protease
MTALDLDSISRSVTKLRAVIPEDAFTAGILGSQRVGNGVVIDSAGLILTIGYLITEATDVWLTGADGREVAAHPLAYDQVTGFGLIMPLQKLDAPPILFGSSADVRAGISHRRRARACWRGASSRVHGSTCWKKPSSPLLRIHTGRGPP